MSTAISFDSSTTPPLPIHRFTVEQYHQLGELGVLTPEDRVELLEGWIVEKMNQKPAHGFAVRLINDWLNKSIHGDWLIQCQLPITTDRSEPEPDIAVVRGQHADYRDRHPRGDDCALIIEVADTSVSKDRGKASIYAAAGVEEYWIVNLIENQLELFCDPQDGTYQTSRVLRSTETVESRVTGQPLKLDLSEMFCG
jgi:Uma2 family endonuclease